MSGLWKTNHRCDVLSVNKFPGIGPVKNEYKMMLRMLPGYDFECFMGEPADAFELVLQQKARVYGDYHTTSADVQAVKDHAWF